MKGLIQLRNRLIALVLLILFSLLSLTSCQIDWSNPFHVHSYVESVVEPTCEEKGYTLKKCSECGYEVKTNYKDALGHDEEIIEGYPKSCSEDGLSDGIYCNTIVPNAAKPSRRPMWDMYTANRSSLNGYASSVAST